MKPLSTNAYTKTQHAQFRNRWGISQWRLAQYLVGVEELVSKGQLPTDYSLGRRISEKYTTATAKKAMTRFVEQGFCRVTAETSKGNAYELTNQGREFLEDYEVVCRRIEDYAIQSVAIRYVESSPTSKQRGEPQQTALELEDSTDFIEVDETLLRTLNSQQKTINSQQKTLANQQKEICFLREDNASQKRQIQSLNEYVAEADKAVQGMDDVVCDQNRRMERMDSYIEELKAQLKAKS